MTPSIWYEVRLTAAGKRHYRVQYRLGGRESPKVAGGTFARLTDAEARMKLIAWEIANGRAPDLRLLGQIPTPPKPLAEYVEAWFASRRNVQEATRRINRAGLAHLGNLAEIAPESITPQDVSTWIGELEAKGLRRSTMRTVLGPLQMLLDFAGVDPNPARHRTVVLPYQKREEITPPPAEHVEAILAGVARKYRLPLCILDATALRGNELVRHRWGDIDAMAARWRVARRHNKGGTAHWVPVPALLFGFVEDLVPREDRVLEDRVFEGLSHDAMRTDMARACKHAGIPLYSPHDLRHRRISLWHRQGVTWAQIGEWAGQRSLATTADIYTHVILDPREVDYGAVLGDERRRGAPSVPPRRED
jgi:integrase